MRTRLMRSKFTLLLLAFGAMVAFAGVALADIVVVNEAGVTGDSLKKPGGTGTARVYLTQSNTDPANDVSGCNANTSNPVSLTLGARNPTTLAEDTDIIFTGNPVSITACDSPGTTEIENPYSIGYTVASGAPDKTVEIYIKSVTGGRTQAGGTITSKYNTTDTHKVRIDGTGPAITINTPPPGASYNVNDVVNASFSCDDGAGNAGTTNCTGTVNNGSPIDTSSAGTKTFTVNASDALGNTSTLSRNYDVINPNTAPTVPGTPSTSSNPNQGDFTLNWAASTDAESNPITYELQHKDANDPGFTTVTGAGSLNTNSYSFTNTSPEAEGTWTYRVRASDGSLSSAFSADSAEIKVDKSAPNAPSASADRPADYDGTGSDDWYKDSVTVSFSANGDPNLLDGSVGSGVNLSTLTAPIPKSTSGPHTVSGTVKDNVGLESAAGSLTVQVDTNAPTFGSCPTGGPFTLNSGSHTVGPISASDTSESGVDSANSTLSGSVNTSTVGSQTVTFTAVDNVGHQSTKQCSYSVIYNWNGFFQPVDNKDTAGNYILNSAKAGSSIPLKFSLSGYQGMAIITSAKSQVIPCSSTAEVDGLETLATAGSSGLNYDSTADQYNYIWKTEKSWYQAPNGPCRQIVVTLNDGTTHRANFKFLRP